MYVSVPLPVSSSATVPSGMACGSGPWPNSRPPSEVAVDMSEPDVPLSFDGDDGAGQIGQTGSDHAGQRGQRSTDDETASAAGRFDARRLQ